MGYSILLQSLMTHINQTEVLKAITEIVNTKQENGIHPSYATDFDLIGRFRIIPKVTLQALIDNGKIKKKNAMNCHYYQII